jgi:ABC-type nitrate/sulfonate/bicarbonate transport system ATPase subunit
MTSFLAALSQVPAPPTTPVPVAGSINPEMKCEYSIGQPLITVENVSLRYGKNQILRDINLQFKNIIRPGMSQGQIIALIGRSGVGKSQLFRILSGLMNPTSGKVLIDLDQHQVNSGEVGIIPQNYLLLRTRTVYDNLRCGSKHSPVKLSKADQDTLIRKYAEDFQLTDHLNKFPKDLSGGQRQRVSIIQQVLTNNKFILLDEPFSGLDSLMVDKVINLLTKISVLNELNTLVIVSHDIPSSLALADDVCILAKEEGKEGATITKRYDLKAMGLAWEPDIRKRPAFQQLVVDVKASI